MYLLWFVVVAGLLYNCLMGFLTERPNMICPPCLRGSHINCTNKETCPCQHRRTEMMADGTVAPQSERGYLLIDDNEKTIMLGNGKRVIVEEKGQTV